MALGALNVDLLRFEDLRQTTYSLYWKVGGMRSISCI